MVVADILEGVMTGGLEVRLGVRRAGEPGSVVVRRRRRAREELLEEGIVGPVSGQQSIA